MIDSDNVPTALTDGKQYVIACIRHTGTGEYAVKLWGPKRSGYTPNLDKAGIYDSEGVAEFVGRKDDFPIELEYAKSISVEREYNYNGWELGRFILNDDLFRNTFGISKKMQYKSPSEKQYFRYKTEVK